MDFGRHQGAWILTYPSVPMMVASWGVVVLMPMDRLANPPPSCSRTTEACSSTPLPKVREPDRPGRPAEDHRGERDTIDSYVEQGSPAEPLVEEPGSRVEIRPEAEVHVQHPHLAYVPFRDEPPHLFHQREEPGPHALHDEEPFFARELDHPFGFGGVHAEGLFTEHSLPGLEAQRGVLRVEGVGGCDVYHVDVGVRGEVIVACVATRDAPPVGELLGRGTGAGSDGEHLGLGHGVQALHKLPRDGARPEYPPPDLSHDLCVPSHLTRPDAQAAMLHIKVRGINPWRLRGRYDVHRMGIRLPCMGLSRRSKAWSTGTSEGRV